MDDPNTAVLDEEEGIGEDFDAELDDDQDDSDPEHPPSDQDKAHEPDPDMPPDPATLAKQLGEIQDAQDEADAAASEYLGAKERAANLKKIWEAKVETLQALVRQSKEPEAPLFNGVQAKQEADATKAAEPQQEDESWKLIPLAEALPGLRKSVLQKLHDAQLTTMGELANWTAEDGGRKRLTDIAGVGEIAAQQIEQAQMDFWSKRANLPAEPKDEPGDDFKFATEADEE